MSSQPLTLDRICPFRDANGFTWRHASELDEACSADWNSLVPPSRVFLRPRFLKVLHDGEPDAFRFLLAYRGDQPVAALAFQLTRLAGRSLRDYVPGPMADTPDRPGRPGFRACVLNLLDRQNWRMVVSGTVFAPSEPGFAFHPSVDAREREMLIRNGMQMVCREWRDVRLLLVTRTDIVMSGFNPIRADSEMVFELDASWQSYSDYLNAMSSKYRVRARKIFKESKSLQRRELEEAEIADRSESLDAAYLEVASRAGFNVAHLGPGHFLRMKQAFGEDFKVLAWFREDSMVGFHSALIRDSLLEARYVGLNYEANLQYRLYQRMLYDFVDIAFQTSCRIIHFGRTAPEIKSTVGAVPEPAGYYLRHRNPLVRTVIAPFLRESGPPAAVIRQPFRRKSAGGRETGGNPD